MISSRDILAEKVEPYVFYSSRLDDFALVTFRLECLVKSLLSTRLGLDNVVVLLLELARGLFLREHLFHKRPLPVLLVDAATIVLRGALDNGADLAKGGHVRLGFRLLVVALRVQHIAHLEQLQVASQLGGQVGLGQVEPFGTSSSPFLLVDSQRGLE